MTWFASGNPLAFTRSPRDRGFVPFAFDRIDAIRHLIMQYSPPTEPFDTSMRRISRAVGFMGYPCVTAFSAFHAYRKFPHLQEVRHVKPARHKKL